MLVNSMLMVPASAMLVWESGIPLTARPAAPCRVTCVTGTPELVLKATSSLHMDTWQPSRH